MKEHKLSLEYMNQLSIIGVKLVELEEKFQHFRKKTQNSLEKSKTMKIFTLRSRSKNQTGKAVKNRPDVING